MIFIVVLGLAIAITAILFAFQNSDIVTISLGVWQFKQSLAIILLITLGLGIIISLLLSIPTIIKRGWQTSKQKKRIQALEAELNERDRQISGEAKTLNLIKQNDRELFLAFDLNDSVTGLLRQDKAVELAEHLLKQISIQQGNSLYSSLCVLLLAVEPAKATQNVTSETQENAIYRAIANRFKNAAADDSFLGVTNKKRFICLNLGMSGEQLNHYGEYLIDTLTETPLQKADGTTMPLKVSIGAAIADPADVIDARNFFKQAEQNLERAREQKRSTILLTEIETKPPIL